MGRPEINRSSLECNPSERKEDNRVLHQAVRAGSNNSRPNRDEQICCRHLFPVLYILYFRAWSCNDRFCLSCLLFSKCALFICSLLLVLSRLSCLSACAIIHLLISTMFP